MCTGVGCTVEQIPNLFIFSSLSDSQLLQNVLQKRKFSAMYNSIIPKGKWWEIIYLYSFYKIGEINVSQVYQLNRQQFICS